MRKVVLDTNGLLRWLLNDIPDQAKIVDDLLHQAADGRLKLLLPQIVIFEIFFALEKFYLQEKTRSIEIVQTLLATAYLQIEEQKVFLFALRLYSQTNVSFVDCFLVAKARFAGTELVTFDKKLKKLIAMSTNK